MERLFPRCTRLVPNKNCLTRVDIIRTQLMLSSTKAQLLIYVRLLNTAELVATV